jgi:tetratricopeptide (TPR) repeat protein
MLDWLKSDRDVETLVIELFNEGVWTFNRETFARYFEEPQPTRAKTLPAMRADCVRLLPMVDKWLGPIEFSRACFSGDPAALQTGRATLVDLDGLASRDDNAAENFLVWALLYACRNDWRRGKIYAESAIESAKLTQHKSAGAEAQFLLSQILRHRRPHAPLRLADDQSRLKRAQERLQRCGISSKDSRVALESAAQLLDGLLLHMYESESAREAAYFEGFGHIEAAQGSAAKDIGTRLRIADIALGYLLLARNREQFPQISTRELYQRLTEHHADLLECLAILRGEGFVNDHIPASTRALEIIGHKVRRDLAKDAGEDFASASPAPVAGDVEALRTALDSATDRVGLFLSSELGRLIVDAEASKDSNLIYVPIWEGHSTGRIFEGLNDDNAVAAAAEANTIAHDVGSNQKVFGIDRSQFQRLVKACALFDEAIELSGGASDEARFYLHMERCYVELLRSRMLSGKAREECLRKLAESYEELDRQHPNSTAIHFRYSIVLSELDRDAEALQEMQAAKACIGQDRLVGEDHWIESTIARRLSVPHAKAADKLAEELRKGPANDDLRAKYLQELRQAFVMVYEGFDLNLHSKTRLGLIEDRRRLNNIVFFAARFLGAGGEASALAEGFDRHELRRYTQKLQSGGIDDPVEWGILHTVGEALSALGHVEEASALADKLVTLIARSGEEIGAARVQNALSDMMTWRRAGAKAAAEI